MQLSAALLLPSFFILNVAWDNGAALTPPMGFANWNVFGCNYDDALFREMADAFVSTGLASKGYEYMLVQECIVPKGARDPVTHIVQPDAKMFPHGLADLAAYFHSKGLKAGIYTDVKSITCAGYEGSGPGPGVPAPGHWPLDALTYAQWGYDMIEADFCNPSGDNETAYELYRAARDAIAAAQTATNRTIAFYACNWGEQGPWNWAPEVANLFRNTGDICSPGKISFDRILSNFDNTVIHSGTPPSRPGVPGTGIGAWNDPDMLGPGMKGITDTEGRTQFSLWCILAAPLMLGTDVRVATPYTLATIGNVEAIAINQDPLGVQGMVLAQSGNEPTPYDGGFLINLAPCPPPAPVFNWTLTADGHLQAVGTDQCATIFECATAPGSPVGAFDCVTNTCGNQLWAFAGGRVTTRADGAAGQCLTGVPGGAGAQLVVKPCAPGGDPLQAWTLGADGRLALENGGGDPLCAWLPDVSDAAVNLYYKPLAPAGGVQPIALAVLNRGAAGVPGQNVSLADLGFAPSQRVVVRDVWAATTSGPVAGAFITRAIDSHETLLLKVTPV